MNPVRRFLSIVVVVSILLAGIPPVPVQAAGDILYVTPEGTTWGTLTGCTSWENSCTLHKAIGWADPGDQIWVMQGNHFPAGLHPAGSAEDYTYSLLTGVGIYGGFRGDETALNQRNWRVYVTVLNGRNRDQGDYMSTALHVVTGSGTDSSAILDGFTIINGYSSGGEDEEDKGAGILNIGGSPTIRNVVIRDNQSTFGDGAGMYNGSGSNPTMVNVTFDGNDVGLGLEANPGNGGGMYNDASSPILNRVTFINNSADNGGGMFNAPGSSPVLTNVTFIGNTVDGGAGTAIANVNSSPLMNHISTSSGNTIYSVASSAPHISNSILWGGIQNTGGSLTIIDSIVSGGCPAGATCTNISSDNPLFGPAGSYQGDTLMLPLLPGSPAIDAGGVNTACADEDQRGALRPLGHACEMGAFESYGFLLERETFSDLSALINTAYDEPLAVRVVSPFNEPVDGGMLTFSAPLSGASTDPVEKVIEIADGSASTNLNANGTAGNFEVSVDGQGVGYSIDFYLTNLNQVLYAKPDGSPTADCFSWANACSLQKALGEATVPGLEVWVAAGTYTPGSTRSATFELQDGVRLYGGFAGVETARTQRNLVSNPTILSGEIGAAGISDNVYHVVTGSDNVILDGFIVTGGNANSSAGVDNNGGGMLNLAVSPNIANVTFENNAASNYGGGVFNYNNTATFYNVTFSGNSALEGGGMMNLDTTQYLDNVTFANNTSFYGGGGISNHGTLILAYATFRGNHSDNRGGAFYNDGSSTISNTIFWGNSATTANPQIYPGAPRATQISTSVVQGGYPAGTGIITSDPRLGSLADNGGFNQTFALGAGSSAIDAGTDSGCPEADQRGIPRPQPIGGSCDIGAYEYVDDESPVVTSFSLVTPTNSLNIPVSGFTAVDNTAVTGYKITSSADVPQAGDSGWTSSAPQAYTVASEGSYTLYPWVKDATGFVSAVYASPATAVVELTSPVLESFTRLVPAGSPVSADTLIFLAVFSEAVQGVEPADFSVNSTSTAGVTAVNAGAAGSYEVTISGGDLGSFTGDVGLNVSDTFLVRDLAGNAVPTVEPVIDEIYQVDHTAPVVSDLSLDVVLLSSISEIEIQFNKQILDLPGDDTDDDVTNPANYMLLQTGENDLYDTVSCGEGWKEDDVSIQVNSISYDDTSFRATLQVNNGEDLDNGEYRLMLCATTSIVDLTGAPINGGIDVVYDFTIAVRNAQPEILPATGFPVGSVTMLPDQPDSAVYSSTKMVLQIPVLEVEMPIVGVLRDENGWDVSWLGRNVGYLEGSAFPTRPGNSVLTGHVWDAANHPGPFAQIHTLQYGDLIRISAWGRIYSYEVRDTSLVTAGNPGDVFQHEEYDWVTLVTCETYDPLQGEYLFRRIVRGVLVSVK